MGEPYIVLNEQVFENVQYFYITITELQNRRMALRGKGKNKQNGFISFLWEDCAQYILFIQQFRLQSVMLKKRLAEPEEPKMKKQKERGNQKHKLSHQPTHMCAHVYAHTQTHMKREYILYVHS